MPFEARVVSRPLRALSDRHGRRRRSAARMPALLLPADIPEDAAGRVAFIAVRPLEDLSPQPDVGAAAVEIEAATATEPARNSWVAVAVLGVLLIAGFLIGMAVTR